MQFSLFFLLVAAVTCADVGTQTKDAFVLAHKQPLSTYAVENMDFVLEYGLYNVGDKPAQKVTIDDRHSFPTNSFEIVKGLLHVHYEKIPAGGNVTHSVVIRPRAFGFFNYTAAQVTYYTDNENLHVTLTNTPGEGYIYRQREYDRRFAPKYTYFLIFFFIVAPTTLGSFLLFQQSKARFPNIVKKKTT
uniref:Translocon-associated protein subunit beta n=1 Tax=Caenorhabditis tropicalis TaxID=1561998 RepID=A0A1I7U7H6_9PELO